jgi:hypothetical protein
MKTSLLFIHFLISFCVLNAQNPKWIYYNTKNSALPHNYVAALATYSSGNKWIATTTSGVSVYKEGGVVLAIEETLKNNIQKTCVLFQNFSNPFTTSTSIKYKVNKPDFVSFKVFELQSIEIASLVNWQKPKGDYSVEWNASDCMSGIYICKPQN